MLIKPSRWKKNLKKCVTNAGFSNDYNTFFEVKDLVNKAFQNTQIGTSTFQTREYNYLWNLCLQLNAKHHLMCPRLSKKERRTDSQMWLWPIWWYYWYSNILRLQKKLRTTRNNGSSLMGFFPFHSGLHECAND